MTPLAFAGIARQAELIRDREISSRELVDLYLERIDRLGPKLNAFRVVCGERARAEADEADRRVAAGEGAPLLGVPIALKDNVDVAGMLTTHGTAAFDEPAGADSATYRRLREAGAVLIGKTTLPELAIWPFTGTQSWGATRNPWNTTRSAGGSSGGSGAAVAAGLVGVASASDGGGSIRIPAANCGLFGLKPQRGRISLGPDPEHWHGLSVSGCLSRRVVDAALWLDVTAGHEPGDVDTPPIPDRTYVEAARSPPGSLRIAKSVSAPRPAAPPIISDDSKAGVARLGELLSSLGHTVVERDPDWGGVGNDITPLFMGGIADDGRTVPHPERLEARTRGMIRLGGLLPEAAIRRSRARASEHAARINRIFEDFDVLLTPVVGIPAPKVGNWAGKGPLRTVLGVSRTYPCHRLELHRPTGRVGAVAAGGRRRPPRSAQLIVPPNREDLLISLAAQLEAETDWPDRIPEEFA